MSKTDSPKVLVVDPILENLEESRKSRQVRRKEKRLAAKGALSGDPLADDFRVFVTLIWRHLNLPDPTELQLDVAYFMQHHERSDEIDRLVIMAFRGMAKSWITGAYALWCLYRNPQDKVGVFSGSAARAVMFVNWCFTLIHEVPALKHLKARPSQRQASNAFDVGPSLPDQTPSMFARGITSATVGFRANVIIGDDVETNTNSMTSSMREKLGDAIKEFDSIIKPGGQIIFLGTPQTDTSIYNIMPGRGYVVKIWTGLFPTGKQIKAYGSRLADYILHKVRNDPRLMGHSAEPTRFSDEDLAARELSLGKADFALQFMLDTSLSDVDKYPLKLSDLIVMSLDRRSGPDLVSWGSGDHLRVQEVDPIGFDTDRLHGPASVSKSFSQFKNIKGFVDPSGQGKDETTLTIGTVLHSTAFVLKQAGWQDGHGEETLKAIANLCVEYRVGHLNVEEDFGQGMFIPLLKPYLKTAWDEHKKRFPDRPTGEASATRVEGVRALKVQKERRIISTLETLFLTHRIVMALSVLEEDFATVLKREGTDLRDRFSLMYQITRLTHEKDCLTHDDRVEGLAGLMEMFKELLGLSPLEASERAEERRLAEEMEKFGELMDGYSPGISDPKKVTSRGRRGQGSRRRKRTRR